MTIVAAEFGVIAIAGEQSDQTKPMARPRLGSSLPQSKFCPDALA